MTQEAINYAKVLFDLAVSRQSVEAFEEIYKTTDKLQEVFNSPVVSLEKKWNIIDEICSSYKKNEGKTFEDKFVNFLKVMCKNGMIDEIADVINEYYGLDDEANHILRAKVFYATKIDEAKMKETEEFLKKKYENFKIDITTYKDESLIGGLLVKVGQDEYDMSYEGKLKQLERIISRR